MQVLSTDRTEAGRVLFAIANMTNPGGKGSREIFREGLKPEVP